MKNLREMDKLYQENSRYKSESEQLKEENKQLEQGLKEVIENLQKYTPGEISVTCNENSEILYYTGVRVCCHLYSNDKNTVRNIHQMTLSLPVKGLKTEVYAR